jgi:hypothetical protein
MGEIEFEAEIREVKSRKLITNDIEYSVRFNTADPIVLELGRLEGDRTVKVKIYDK